MEEEVFVSTLPWSWVIEALAKSELVDSTLLCELVSKVPPLTGDSGKHAKEAAALRCLEGFIGRSNVLSENHVASEIRFDPTESCETALQHILSQTSGSKDASDELKWGVQSFVKHKKASLPKSTLELLKDVILEDNHPLAASLKEIGGLSVRDQCVLNSPFGGGDPTYPPLRSDEDDRIDKTILVEENGSLPRSGIDDQPVEAYPRGNLLPCGGGISNHHTDDHVQEIDATSDDVDHQCPPGKKRKIDKGFNTQAMHLNSVPVVCNQVCNGADDGQYNVVVEANRIHDEKSHKDVDKQNRGYEGKHDEQQISPNNSDHCHEENDLARKKTSFLNSHRAFSEDPVAMIDTEPNLCMKCNKDGHLLSCSASTCPLLFHESCLGSSVRFDDQGSFYCPFCSYSRAISEYVKAKEKVSLRRKELSLFIGGKAGDQPKHDGDTSSGDDVNLDKHQNGEKRAEVEKDATVRHNISFKGDANQNKYENNEKRVVEKDVNVRHKDGDKTTKLRKSANVVAQVVMPQLRSSKRKQVENSHSSACMDVNEFVVNAQQHLSFKDRQGGEIIIQLSRDPFQIYSHGQDDGANLSGDNELRSLGKTTKCKITELDGDASSESISNSDSDVRHVPLPNKNNGTSSFLSPTPLRAMPNRRTSPQGRRKKVPWTAEEEAMLKKGVELFVQQDRTIPWKNILEYGSSVFLNGRTAVDLKDKWRNMMRGSSPKVK